MKMRGLDERQELSPHLLLRDTRTMGMKIVDFFKDPLNSAILMFTFTLSAYFFSMMVDVIFVIGVFVFLYAYTRKTTLPFRLPLRSKADDYNDPLPGSNKPRKARGIAFFGKQPSDRR